MNIKKEDTNIVIFIQIIAYESSIISSKCRNMSYLKLNVNIFSFFHVILWIIALTIR